MRKADKRFREHVTSTAFNLQLSSNMIFTLSAIKLTKYFIPREVLEAAGFRYDPVNSGRALERRGLIYSPDPDKPGHKALTPAGEHVYALLEIAGLVGTFDAILEEGIEASKQRDYQE